MTAIATNGRECRLQQDTANKADFLIPCMPVAWLPKSIAARGVDERRWMRYLLRHASGAQHAGGANRKCRAAETGLSLEMANKLNNVMSDRGGTSSPERYEYAKHGVCFGLIPTHGAGATKR